MLTTILIYVSSFQLQAADTAKDIKVSVHFENASFQEVLSYVEAHSRYRFFYNNRILSSANSVTITLSRVPIEKALVMLLREAGLSFKIHDEQVVLKRKSGGRGVSEVFKTPDVVSERDTANVSTTLSASVPDYVVSGKVASEIGEPLPGVNVLVKGTTIGTTTDREGLYSLSVADGSNPTLVFSFIGYKTKEVEVTSQTVIDISMELDTKELEEVVVLGYGTQRKSDLTGAVGQVKSEDIKNLPLVSVEQALQGRVSGVRVKRNAGDPKGNFGINIRGVNSTSNGGQPLYVVDGVPLATGTLSNINPSDIESLDVLKDASATAIYGARAANGVVMITTKLGSARKIRDVIEFSSEIGVLTPVIPFEMADAFLQAEIVKESLAEAMIAIPAELNDPAWLAENNNDWQELASRNGKFERYNLSLSGGSEKTQYLVSAYYSHTKGVLINSDYEIGGFRLNLDHQVTGKLKIGTRVSGGIDGGNVAPTNGFWSVWKQALMDMPWFPHKDAEGKYKPITTTGVHAAHSFNNPISEMEQNVYDNSSNSFVGNTYIEYTLVKGLKFKYLLGGEVNTIRNYNFFPIYDHGAYKRLATVVNDGQTKNTNWVSDATLSFDKHFNAVHKVTAMAGYSAQRFDSRSLSVSGQGAFNNQIDQISGQPIVTSSGGILNSGLSSYFARVFYSFKDKYLITATVRRDGSSRFSPSQKWGNFPSASIGWNMSEEPFMENIRAISNLKWRVSYGLTGNQDIPSFRFMPLLSPNNYAFGNALAPGFAVNNPANPFLQWESLKQFDAGLEMSFFDGRINTTFDYFVKRSDNLLSNTALAPTAGYTGTLTKNIGIIENRGFEMELSTINTVGTFKWSTGLNFSFVRNEVINLGLDINGDPLSYQGIGIYQSTANLTTAGQPIASFYGYVFDGIWQLGEESEAAAAFPNLKPGDIKFRDLDNDGKITANDRTFIGSPHPTFYGGFTNNITYKNLTLSVFADFAMGARVLNTPRMLGESTFWYQGSMEIMKDRWTSENPSNTLHRAAMSTAAYNARVSSHYTEKADFFRINNVALTYNFPASIVNSLKMQGLQLSVIGNNVHTFTGYKGYNVEAHTGGGKNDPLSAGLDMGTYPLSRMYSVKLNVTF